MSNAFDHLHIKRHTKGSSNELSFDVLDAARDASESKPRRFRGLRTPGVFRPTRPAEDRQTVPQQEPLIPVENEGSIGEDLSEGLAGQDNFVEAPAIPLPTTPAAGRDHMARGKSALSEEAEVARRKHRRRYRLIIMWTIVTIAAIAAVLVAAYMGYQHNEKIELFQTHFNGLVDKLVEADASVPLMETFMENPFVSSEENRTALKEAIKNSNSTLDQLSADLTDAYQFAVTEEDELALEQVETARAARSAMMTSTSSALDAVDAAVMESSEVNAAWHSVLGADEVARSAAALANSADNDDLIKQSRDQSKDAQDKMRSVKASIEKVAKERSDLDLSAYIAYLDKRIESLDHAIATSEALLAGDKEKAASENEAYNRADEEAAVLAQGIPLSSEDAVEGTFEETVKACVADYREAREKAVESDLLIRQYLKE